MATCSLPARPTFTQLLPADGSVPCHRRRVTGLYQVTIRLAERPRPWLAAFIPVRSHSPGGLLPTPCFMEQRDDSYVGRYRTAQAAAVQRLSAPPTTLFCLPMIVVYFQFSTASPRPRHAPELEDSHKLRNSPDAEAGEVGSTSCPARSLDRHDPGRPLRHRGNVRSG